MWYSGCVWVLISRKVERKKSLEQSEYMRRSVGEMALEKVFLGGVRRKGYGIFARA